MRATSDRDERIADGPPVAGRPGRERPAPGGGERRPARRRARTRWQIAGLLSVLLLLPGIAAAAEPLTIELTASQPVVAPGDVLRVSVGVAYSAAGGPGADLFVGVILPDGNTVVTFGPGGATGVGTLGHLATLPAFLTGLSAPAALPLQPALEYRWTGSEPPGQYVLFGAAVRAGSLADGDLGSGDLLSLATRTVRLDPEGAGAGDWHAFGDSRPVDTAANVLTRVQAQAAQVCSAPPSGPIPSLSDAVASLVAGLQAMPDGPALAGFVTGVADATRLPVLAAAALADRRPHLALAGLLAAGFAFPQDPAHLVNAAGVASLLGFPAEALALLAAADQIGLDGFSPLGIPGRALAQNNRGHALLGLGRWAEAEAALAEAVALAPQLSEARNSLGLAILCQSGDGSQDQAVRLFRAGRWRTLGPAVPTDPPVFPPASQDGGPEVTAVTVEATRPTAMEAPPGPGLVTVRRTGDLGAELTVAYAVSGTATPDVDYVPLPGTLTIPAGVFSVELPVVPREDDLDEPDETVVVTVVPGAGYQVGPASTATVTIGRFLLPAGRAYRAVNPEPAGQAVEIPHVLDLSAGVEDQLPGLVFPPTAEDAERYLELHKRLVLEHTQRSEALATRIRALTDMNNARPPFPRLIERRIQDVEVAVYLTHNQPGIRDLFAETQEAHREAAEVWYELGRRLDASRKPYEAAHDACHGERLCIRRAYAQYFCEPVRQNHPRWLQAIRRLDTASRAYYGPASRYMTAVAANIADPVRHERLLLEGVGWDGQVTYMQILSLAVYYAKLEAHYFNALSNCAGSTDAPPDPPPPVPTLTDPGACPPGLSVAKAQIKFLDVVSLAFNCETVELEVAEPGLGLFGQIGFTRRPGQRVETTLFVGAKGSVPGLGLSAKEGFFLRTDGEQLIDGGFKVSMSNLIGAPVGGLKVDSPFNAELGVAAAYQYWSGD